jgi:P27 family predicted phage terminase small subunit
MPARKPRGLLLLNGRGDGKDSAGYKVPLPPRFRRQAPTPPSWLDREARAEWRRITPGLERLDLLKQEDRATLAVYCSTWSRYVAATRDIERNGLTVQNRSIKKDGTETVWFTKNPAVAIAQAASTELRHYAALFGLSPADEGRLGTTPDDTDDESNPFSPNYDRGRPQKGAPIKAGAVYQGR